MPSTRSEAPLPASDEAPVDETAGQVATTGSRADVATGAPARYAKQLISHLGRKVAFTGDATTSAATAAIGAATAGILVGNGVLTLWAAGDDEESVARVEHVLGSHLERFARREILTVRWVRTAGVPVSISGALAAAPATTTEESA
ncbi:DUF2218 domain-containing protein [Blastococcus deserti]|uniref:DUF2218 domain-containing protein n=1 Tax=Blastococcus deserti TaxID=2259033 RepID=A0ABW4X8S7_9ACTN